MMRKLNFPLIFLAYLVTLLYFAIFTGNLLVICLFIGTFILAMYRKFFLLMPILLVFAGFFGYIKMNEIATAAHQPRSISQIRPIPGTLQVNGNLLSFQGTDKSQKFQDYYVIKTPAEQKFYKNLTQDVQLTIAGKLEKPEKQRNFNGFDAAKYEATQNIYRQVNITQIEKIHFQKRPLDLHLWRRKALVWVQNHFPKPLSSYMNGLLFGYLGKDFSQMSDIYSSLGIIHLFALSGMQVNFFIDWLRKILLRLGLTRETVDKIQVPFSVFYAFMTGLSVSVLRALFQKNLKCSGLDNFALTLLLLILIFPQALLTMGGQLTLLYAFVLAVLPRQTTKNALLNAGLLSLMTLPLLIFDFHIFQPRSIVLTFLFGLLFDTVLLLLLLIMFGLSFVNIILPMNFIFVLLEKIVHWVDIPLHYPPVFGSPKPWQLLIILILSGLFIDFYKRKNVRTLLISSLILLYLFVKLPVTPSITMVDVGQGDSIFLQDKFNSQNILIDTGGKVSFQQKQAWQVSNTSSNADKTLIPYLQSIGVGQIDNLILTHTDDDHVGDFVELSQKIKIKQVWVSPGELNCSDFVAKLKAAKVPIKLAHMGATIPIFKSHLQFLSTGYTQKGDNNDSMVTYGNFFGKKFLFTGDLEQDGEMKLLQAYPKLKVDVLKVGHHGSKTSSNPEFIKKIKPQLALISVGKNNRYGHPNQETLTTLAKYHVPSLRTDQHGAIKLIKRKQKWHIVTVK